MSVATVHSPLTTRHSPLALRDTRDPSEKRPFIHALFSTLAPRYDWFNRLASLGLDQRWRRQTVRLGGIAPGQRVLDACTGTGDLALLCARQQQGQGTVIGMDFTRPMLAEAQDKQRRARLAVTWLQGDAEALPFAARSFDRVLIGFSTRNLSHLSEGIHEMVRVLVPGGQLLILETGYPTRPVLRAGYQLFLFTIARTIGVLLTGRVWPFTYLARSVRQFLTPQAFTVLLERSGTTVHYVPLSHGLASLYIATRR